MKIKVFSNEPAHYVPNILFEDGTYKSRQDYINEVKAMTNLINTELAKGEKRPRKKTARKRPDSTG